MSEIDIAAIRARWDDASKLYRAGVVAGCGHDGRGKQSAEILNALIFSAADVPVLLDALEAETARADGFMGFLEAAQDMSEIDNDKILIYVSDNEVIKEQADELRKVKADRDHWKARTESYAESLMGAKKKIAALERAVLGKCWTCAKWKKATHTRYDPVLGYDRNLYECEHVRDKFMRIGTSKEGCEHYSFDQARFAKQGQDTYI